VAVEIIEAHPWTGTGAMNFDRYYLQHKPVEYPEEIKDPHNFMVSGFAQGGIFGGAGMLALFLGTSYVAAQNWGRTGEDSVLKGSGPPKETGDQLVIFKLWMVGLAAGFVLLRLLVLRGYFQLPQGGAAYVYFDLLTYGLIWIVVMAGMLWMADKGSLKGHAYRAPLLCGAIAFLLMNVIGFSLFTPAGLTVFAALGALLIGRGDLQKNDKHASRGSLWPLIICGIGLIGFLYYLFVPVNVVVAELEHGHANPLNYADDSAYKRAREVDPFDPVPWEITAERFVASKQYRNLDKAVHYLKGAIKRDPLEQALYSKLSQLYLLRYNTQGDTSELRKAVAAGERAVALYPSSPDAHAELGDLLMRTGKELQETEYLASARDHLQSALALDAARPREEIRRWPAGRREMIRERLAKVRELIEQLSSSAA
jgi:tetratricopeptide (TPR) repeat protein